MTNESATVLKTLQSMIEQASPSYLCERCWAYVPSGDEHRCDPDERAMAILRVSQPVLYDPKRRAKGYRV